jgi:hypothetical protein
MYLDMADGVDVVPHAVEEHNQEQFTVNQIITIKIVQLLHNLKAVILRDVVQQHMYLDMADGVDVVPHAVEEHNQEQFTMHLAIMVNLVDQVHSQQVVIHNLVVNQQVEELDVVPVGQDITVELALTG